MANFLSGNKINADVNPIIGVDNNPIAAAIDINPVAEVESDMSDFVTLVNVTDNPWNDNSILLSISDGNVVNTSLKADKGIIKVLIPAESKNRPGDIAINPVNGPSIPVNSVGVFSKDLVNESNVLTKTFPIVSANEDNVLPIVVITLLMPAASLPNDAKAFETDSNSVVGNSTNVAPNPTNEPANNPTPTAATAKPGDSAANATNGSITSWMIVGKLLNASNNLSIITFFIASVKLVNALVMDIIDGSANFIAYPNAKAAAPIDNNAPIATNPNGPIAANITPINVKVPINTTKLPVNAII